MRDRKNSDSKTIEGFGREWQSFDQSKLNENEAGELFKAYFRVFPWDQLSDRSVGFDLGCGSGRWARLVAPRVGHLHCIDPSEALDVARRNLSSFKNCEFHFASTDNIPLAPESMDFGYSLGVLHHIPDTERALASCVLPLKPDAPFLVYLYYAFDNRPAWFRLLWKASDLLRRSISCLPYRLRYVVSQVIAVLIYFPLARISALMEKLGVSVSNWPLSSYRQLSMYTMRTDALDRFGTRLEHRFTREEIEAMMKRAGLERIRFSDDVPYWCAVGFKSASGGAE